MVYLKELSNIYEWNGEENFTHHHFYIIISFLHLQRQPSPSEVVQWSNHRVMEWLRAVDLAEYAPNLRGSGVHGGLIVSTAHFEFFASSNFESHWHLMFVFCLLPPICSFLDPGASLQLRDFGPAVKYSSTEDFAPAPPRHCLLRLSGASGHTGEARVWQCHRPRAPHYHC